MLTLAIDLESTWDSCFKHELVVRGLRVADGGGEVCEGGESKNFSSQGYFAKLII